MYQYATKSEVTHFLMCAQFCQYHRLTQLFISSELSNFSFPRYAQIVSSSSYPLRSNRKSFRVEITSVCDVRSVTKSFVRFSHSSQQQFVTNNCGPSASLITISFYQYGRFVRFFTDTPVSTYSHPVVTDIKVYIFSFKMNYKYIPPYIGRNSFRKYYYTTLYYTYLHYC